MFWDFVFWLTLSHCLFPLFKRRFHDNGTASNPNNTVTSLFMLRQPCKEKATVFFLLLEQRSPIKNRINRRVTSYVMYWSRVCNVCWKAATVSKGWFHKYSTSLCFSLYSARFFKAFQPPDWTPCFVPPFQGNNRWHSLTSGTKWQNFTSHNLWFAYNAAERAMRTEGVFGDSSNLMEIHGTEMTVNHLFRWRSRSSSARS